MLVALLMFLILWLGCCFCCCTAQARSYDSAAYTECYPSPARGPLYDGGVLRNPSFDEDLEQGSWTQSGGCLLSRQKGELGDNSYLVAFNRSFATQGMEHPISLEAGYKYSLSAWVQVSGSSSALVRVHVESAAFYSCAGTLIAKAGCWSFFKGGIDSDVSLDNGVLAFWSTDPNVEIWLDNASLQPFSNAEWKEQRSLKTNKFRKRDVRLTVLGSDGRGIPQSSLQVDQLDMLFPFGSAIAAPILDNIAYQRWFTERFNTAVFENELKWYFTEPNAGNVSYEVADKLLAFCKANRVAVRGHNIFWEDPKFTPEWVRNLSTALELLDAVINRIRSLMGHFKGQFLQWDVDNEMLHFSYFGMKLGPEASNRFYECAQEMDPDTPLFMNEFNVIETCQDDASTPDAYIQRLRTISQSGKVMEGIGLEAHFNRRPNLAYMRAVLDKMGALKLPIWLTELDVANIPGQAHYLDEILREAFAHHSVKGIVFWSAIHKNGACWRMCLTNEVFANLQTGNVVDAFLAEHLSRGRQGITSAHGAYRFSGLLHGQYQVSVVTPDNQLFTQNFNVSGSERGVQEVIVSLQ